LLRGLRKEGVYKPDKGWGLLIARVMVATTVLVAALYYAYADMNQWLQWHASQRAMYLLMWVGIGGAAYFVTLFVLRTDFRELLRHHD